MNESSDSGGELAADLLRRLRGHFDTARDALARACAVKGRLDAQRFDAHQVSAFELAWACAELEAARAALQVAATPTDRALVRLFTADVIGANLGRLEALHLELGLDLAPLQALSAGADWARLRRETQDARTLQRTGQAVIDAQGDIAAVTLSEPLTMAQRSFRRFGAEVVAPLAEPIHRHDLTIPESILGPLREMGVFGLSIPERYGGIGPDDRDDTLMMVVVTEALSEASLGAAGSLITRPEILSRAMLTGGTEVAKRNMIRVELSGSTIPHEIIGKFGAGRVLLRPASPGTGIIAGKNVRAVMECLGVHDVLSKSLGSNNPHNEVKAAFSALLELTSPGQLSRRLNRSLRDIYRIEAKQEASEA